MCETAAHLDAAPVRWPAFFDVNPRWEIFAFGSAPVLRFAGRAEKVGAGVELVRMPGMAVVGQPLKSRFDVRVDESGAEFLKRHPADRRVLSREKVIVAVHEDRGAERVMGGCTLLADDSGNVLVTTIWVEGGLRHRNIVGVAYAKEIVTTLLAAVADAVDGEIWILVEAEDSEVLECAVGLGWRVNRNWWRLEGKKEVVKRKDGAGGQGWELGDWGKGMKGWREEWVKALEKIA